MSSSDVERQGAQALLATFMQMSRYTQLAQSLHGARERSLTRRLNQSVDEEETARLQQQLEGQQMQAATLSGAARRFQASPEQLGKFADAGVTFEDFEKMGLTDVVDRQEIEKRNRSRDEAASHETDNSADSAE